jgi:prenyltransferase beta subunit
MGNNLAMSASLLIVEASRSRALLGESAELVRQYLLGQLNPDGGGRNREGKSDLYYTVFVLQGLAALGGKPPLALTTGFLAQFGDGDGLDLVHLASLVRCRMLLQAPVFRTDPSQRSIPFAKNESCLRQLARFQAGAGGYTPIPQAKTGTLYGLYLAKGIYEDLGLSLGGEAAAFVRKLELPTGGWANEPGVSAAATTVGAAAVSLLRHFNEPAPASATAWFLRHFHPQGGFRANLAAPLPDLLSTATALHALKEMGHNLNEVREPCLDFLDSLWTNEGGFHGHWADDLLDSEYTFYGLLALGCLA